jgi:hypothetical protein
MTNDSLPIAAPPMRSFERLTHVSWNNTEIHSHGAILQKVLLNATAHTSKPVCVNCANPRQLPRIFSLLLLIYTNAKNSRLTLIASAHARDINRPVHLQSAVACMQALRQRLEVLITPLTVGANEEIILN